MNNDLTCRPVVIRAHQRPLFGLHHAPVGVARAIPVVLCPALGYENLVAYRTYRHLAERLCAQGFHVLRFDYFGTGNSAGLASDAAELRADVHAAMDHLKQLTGAGQVCVFGVRAGGLLAAAVAAERKDVAGLILLAVPQSGRMLVRELKAFQAMTATEADEAVQDGGLNLVGFEFPPALQAELEQINLIKTDFSAVQRVLVLSRDDLANDDKLIKHCTESGCEVRQVAVAGYAAMMTTTEASEVPRRLLQHIQEWLQAFVPLADNATTLQTGPAPLLSCEHGGVALQEEVVRFGPQGRLFGVLTQENRAEERRSRRAVLLLSVGANHHIGSGRIYVSIARELAARGLVALRFDISGLGESAPESGKEENVIYDPDSVNDVTHAMEFLSQVHKVDGFILSGICLGAHLAFYAPPVKKQIVGRLLVNWAVFEVQPPVHAKDSVQRSFKSRSYYFQALFAASTWHRLVRGEVAGLSITRHLFKQTRDIVATGLKRVLVVGRGRDHSTNPVEQKMKSILQAGVPTWLVYSAGDPALDGLQLYLGREAAWVQDYPGFDMRVVDGADHAFSRPVAQQALRNIMQEFVSATDARVRTGSFKRLVGAVADAGATPVISRSTGGGQ